MENLQGARENWIKRRMRHDNCRYCRIHRYDERALGGMEDGGCGGPTDSEGLIVIGLRSAVAMSTSLSAASGELFSPWPQQEPPAVTKHKQHHCSASCDGSIPSYL